MCTCKKSSEKIKGVSALVGALVACFFSAVVVGIVAIVVVRCCCCRLLFAIIVEIYNHILFIIPAYQDTVRDRKMCFFVKFSAEEQYFVDLFGVFIFVLNASLRS